jgi:hypothetical protein
MLNDLIGKRILVKTLAVRYGVGSSVEEIKIVEISPSGNWIKILNGHGSKFWKAASDIALIEVLKDLREGKPAT